MKTLIYAELDYYLDVPLCLWLVRMNDGQLRHVYARSIEDIKGCIGPFLWIALQANETL